MVAGRGTAATSSKRARSPSRVVVVALVQADFGGDGMFTAAIGGTEVPRDRGSFEPVDFDDRELRRPRGQEIAGYGSRT